MKAIDVTFIDSAEPVRVTLRAADYVRLERSIKRNVLEGMTYEDTMRLSFNALVREGRMPEGLDGFEKYVNAVDDVDPVTDEEAEATDPLADSPGL